MWRKIFVLLIILCFLPSPLQAAPIINPSVESESYWCRFYYTQWICDLGGAGGAGATGPAGPPGEGNTTNIWNSTVAVNYTFTGEAGTDANVTNIGNESALLLDFTIPQGIQGEQGEAGIQGEQGVPGEAGEQGLQGEIGLTGEQGIQGIQGEQGEPGETPDTSPFLFLNGTRNMTGILNAGGFNVSNLLDPVSPQDAATKSYCDVIGNKQKCGASTWES